MHRLGLPWIMKNKKGASFFNFVNNLMYAGFSNIKGEEPPGLSEEDKTYLQMTVQRKGGWFL